MPRLSRIIEAGFYHVINRGVERRVIFYEEDDETKSSINYIVFRQTITPPSFFDNWKSHLNLVKFI